MINNAAAGQDRFLSLEVFSASWALCLVLSKLSRTALDTPWAAATFAVAVVAMLRPREPRWLVAAAVARLVEYATDLPDNTQHFYLNAAFALAVVVGYAASAFRLRTLMPAPQRLFEALAPGVRMIAITCLFWAGAAKLNTDFLDPELSCASQLYDYQRYYVPLLPDADWARSAAPFLAIVGELGAALLLVFRPTRALGIAVGWRSC